MGKEGAARELRARRMERREGAGSPNHRHSGKYAHGGLKKVRTCQIQVFLTLIHQITTLFCPHSLILNTHTASLTLDADFESGNNRLVHEQPSLAGSLCANQRESSVQAAATPQNPNEGCFWQRGGGAHPPSPKPVPCPSCARICDVVAYNTFLVSNIEHIWGFIARKCLVRKLHVKIP